MRTTLCASVVVLGLITASALAAGCTSGASPSPSGAMTVEGAWARPSMGVAGAGAAYLLLTNETGSHDALVGASSPAAATVEIHETMAGDSGMMGMQPVEKIFVPAGGTVELKPGGYHLMLIDLTQPLQAGKTIELTLTFEKAPPVTVIAEIRQG